MIIYRDLISGDEMFSDSYPMKVVDDFYYEVEGKIVSESTGISDDMIGANASAEGGDEGVDDQSRTGINVVMAHRLEKVQMDKKEYQAHVKKYLKALKEKLEKRNPDRVATFMTAAQEQVKKIFGSFKDWDLYVGENMDPDGMHALLNYREDGITPYFRFFKDGLEEEKF